MSETQRDTVDNKPKPARKIGSSLFPKRLNNTGKVLIHRRKGKLTNSHKISFKIYTKENSVDLILLNHLACYLVMSIE